MAKPANITIHIPKKTSILSKPQCLTRSAFERNLKASASSKKPRTTFVVFSQPPDLGNALSKFGNIANKAKGRPRASPKPPIPAVSCHAPPSAVREPAKRDPSIGPVHEKETIDKVRAMKKIPRKPPIPSPLVVELVHFDGKVNS